MSRRFISFFFFFNDTATTEIYTLSLHDALPISVSRPGRRADGARPAGVLPLLPRALARRRRKWVIRPSGIVPRPRLAHRRASAGERGAVRLAGKAGMGPVRRAGGGAVGYRGPAAPALPRQ